MSGTSLLRYTLLEEEHEDIQQLGASCTGVYLLYGEAFFYIIELYLHLSTSNARRVVYSHRCKLLPHIGTTFSSLRSLQLAEGPRYRNEARSASQGHHWPSNALSDICRTILLASQKAHASNREIGDEAIVAGSGHHTKLSR